MTPLERIRTAWHGENRVVDLNGTVEILAREGTPLLVLDEALGALLDEVRANGSDESQEEIILTVGDRLHGWCHESRRIDTQTALLGSTVPVPNALLKSHSFQPTSAN